ncbi:MAG: dihydroorotate dehydrogenase electron transfer subunit [Chitinispirillaceae bacterium]|nr:dihydroorotate dehydrogenase electron transfer subunit [Chitinispirillaceae bacterium]
MKQFCGKIIGNRPLSADYFELAFTWDKKAGRPLPGQFFTLRISDSTVPLLRRPFAFSSFDAKKSTASMIYQRRGRGTAILAAKEKGEQLDLIGPLGKPFPLPGKMQNALLVAGGIGLGPLLFLASRLRKAQLVVGCRTKNLVPSFRSCAGLRPVVCTDDGTKGFMGTAGDYLKSIEKVVAADTVIYACGPLPLLKACHEFALGRGGECFVSVEQVMACGVGACMGCAVKSAGGGYTRACTEGPVFNSKELKWD